MATRVPYSPDPENAEDGLAELQARIRACRQCEEHGYIEKAWPIVSGRATDQVMLIGQAPGRVSHERGYPFAGPGGRILSRWLDQAGFPADYFRQHTYIASLTRCFPGPSHSGNGDRPPSREELKLCRPFLEAELALVRPRIVLLVGKMAIEAFWGRVRLDDVVGTHREKGGTLYLPLPHPSGVSRWLNDPTHVEQTDRALRQLEDWRQRFGLEKYTGER